MPTIFISYCRVDAPSVQPLAEALRADGIHVWRDVDNLYGGEHWPRVIGEAVAAADLVLLVWSQHAAASHFVDQEWNTAVAQRKAMLPCLLDATPLPPALSAINAIVATPLPPALGKIRQAVRRLLGMPDSQTPIVPDRGARWWRRPWSLGIMAAIVLAILAGGVVSVLDLLPWLQGQRLQPLAGVVWDEQRQTLAAVEVFLPEFDRTAFTDQQGKFFLQVRAAPQRPVRLVARKAGYEGRDTEATLGNTSLSFVLRRTP